MFCEFEASLVCMVRSRPVKGYIARKDLVFKRFLYWKCHMKYFGDGYVDLS